MQDYQPPPLHAAVEEKCCVTGKPLAMEKPLMLKLNCSLDAPVIKLPKSTDNPDYIEFSPGKVEVKNAIYLKAYENGNVYIDEMEIFLTKLQFLICVDGKKGSSMVHHGDAVDVKLSRPLNFIEGFKGRIGVNAFIPKVRLDMSKKEYHFIISAFGENFATRSHIGCCRATGRTVLVVRSKHWLS